jgi:hypothetical protein
MTRTSMGQLLVNEALPEDMRDYDRTLDKKGVNQLLRELAEKHPDKYVEVSKKLNDIGRTWPPSSAGTRSAWSTSRRPGPAARKIQDELPAEVQKILDDDRLTPQQRNDLIVKTAGRVQQQQIDEILRRGGEGRQPAGPPGRVRVPRQQDEPVVAARVGPAVRRPPRQRDPAAGVQQLLRGPQADRILGRHVRRPQGTMATKFATQDAGFLSKQLNQVAHRLMVVDEDDPRAAPRVGLPVDTDDPDNEGSLLARDVGPYKRNTVLTPRSSSTCGDRPPPHSGPKPDRGRLPDGGVYARDVGVRERGTLPGRGEQVWTHRRPGSREPLSQGQLSAKHSGGVAGQEKAVGGFQYINQLIQVPKKFKGGAAHSTKDGRVEGIEEAPAGGHYVYVGGERHYVGAGYDLKVKKGTRSRPGTSSPTGIPNPAAVVEHKGIGEGRRYFVQAFRDAMRDAGMKADRRNVEVLARGLINHVRLTDELGEHVPDDVVPYSTIEHVYQPRDDHRVVEPDRAVGQYLESPVLHYSVGTRVRPSVLKELKEFGIGKVAVHRDPPPFQPEMIRGMYSLQHDPDPFTRMYGSGLQTGLLEAVHRGRTSDETGTSFVPGLMRAVDFGRTGQIRQPEPGTPPPPEGQPFGDADMKKKRSPAALDLPAPAASPAPPKSFFGAARSLFKLSLDQMAARKEADQVLARVKAAQSPPGTNQSNPGSSTVNTSGSGPRPPAPAGGADAPPPQTPAHAPGMTNPYAAIPTPHVPEPPEPPKPGGWTPSGVTQPHPAGTVSPDREQAMHGGSLWRAGEHPALLSRFVMGGGRPDDPESGYGGLTGAAVRFGSLLDENAVSSLTRGPRQERPQAGHPNQGGGPESDEQPPWLRAALGQVPTAQMTTPVPQPRPPVSSAEAAAPAAGRGVAESVAGQVGPRVAGEQALKQTVRSAAKPVAGVAAGEAERAAIRKLVPTALGRGATKVTGGPWATPVNAAMEGLDHTVGTPEFMGGEGFGKPTPFWNNDRKFDAETSADGKILGGAVQDPTGGALSYAGAAFNGWSKPVQSGKTIAVDAPSDVVGAVAGGAKSRDDEIRRTGRLSLDGGQGNAWEATKGHAAEHGWANPLTVAYGAGEFGTAALETAHRGLRNLNDQGGFDRQHAQFEQQQKLRESLRTGMSAYHAEGAAAERGRPNLESYFAGNTLSPEQQTDVKSYIDRTLSKVDPAFSVMRPSTPQAADSLYGELADLRRAAARGTDKELLGRIDAGLDSLGHTPAERTAKALGMAPPSIPTVGGGYQPR